METMNPIVFHHHNISVQLEFPRFTGFKSATSNFFLSNIMFGLIRYMYYSFPPVFNQQNNIYLCFSSLITISIQAHFFFNQNCVTSYICFAFKTLKIQKAKLIFCSSFCSHLFLEQGKFQLQIVICSLRSRILYQESEQKEKK